MSQRKYIEDMLVQHCMKGCKPAPTPMNSNEKLQAYDGSGEADALKYRSLIGKLIYLTHTRPDISYVVGMMSRFMGKPTKHHQGVAKRVIRYLVGTQEFGLWYTKTNQCKLEGYTDSEWAGFIDDRKSTSSMVFSLGSSPISWCSKKQKITALSSMKAEFVATSAAACQCVWLRRMLADFGMEQKEATTLWCDNRSTITIT